MEWKVDGEWKMSMKWEVEDGEEERRGMEGEGSGVFMGEPEGGWLVSTRSRKLPGWANW